MAEITNHAYQDLRNYIQDNWKYIELQDEADSQIIRLSPSDSRVEWTHDTNNQVLQLQVVINGADSEITLPQTFAKSVIYDKETGGNAYSVEEFTPFTMETEEDELTVIHSIEVPKVE